MTDILYIVVPCYNEEEVLPETSKRLGEKLDFLKANKEISEKSRILFVDDGSKDNTWSIISELHDKNDDTFSGLKLSKNKGHQNALVAGLMAAKHSADFTISIDADLQDDIDAIDKMVQKYHQGCHIVYGVRNDRQTDSAFKRGTAQSFYKFMKLLGVDIVYNHADYRLMSKTVIEDLSDFSEVNLFLRGMTPLIGYKTGTVEYARGERFAGTSKYPLKKMLDFAWNGITSFSIKPIRFISVIGVLIMLGCLAFIIYSIIAKILGVATPGWSSLIISIWFLGGLNLLAVGLVGEYVGKTYMETKRRPLYFVETLLDK